MRKLIGIVLIGLGGIGGCSVCGIWGLILSLIIVYQVTEIWVGIWGVIVGLALFPITFFIVPWYAGLELGNWFPLIISYGGFFGGMIIILIGSAFYGPD